MSKIRFVGDIHGKVPQYLQTIEGTDESIQIGDFGLGFGTRGQAAVIDALIDQVPGRHRFIRGNHDSPDECLLSSHFIDDGRVEGPMMFVGGASSIDREHRTEGIDWWPDEELSYERLLSIVDLYAEVRPPILITHECPEFFAVDHMIPLVRGNTNFPSRTRMALDAMYRVAQPKLHIFGHWHQDLYYRHYATGTTLICLNELSFIDIETDDFT